MGEGGLNRLKDRMRGISGEELSQDDTYVTYHDVRLTNEDVYTLKHDWLTDNVIAFWEEYLERETLSNYKTSQIVLLRPSMSFLLLQTQDPKTLKDALPDLSKTSHIFVPVNDCRTVTVPEGGTHWSLLLVSVVDGIAFHYDSLGTGNISEGMTLTKKFMMLVNRELRFMHLEDTPQQENGSDCGIFVCMAMRHLLVKRLLMANASQQVAMSLTSTDMDVSAGRKEMFRIIERHRRKMKGKPPS